VDGAPSPAPDSLFAPASPEGMLAAAAVPVATQAAAADAADAADAAATAAAAAAAKQPLTVDEEEAQLEAMVAEAEAAVAAKPLTKP